MFCKKYDIELTETNTYVSDHRYCIKCGNEYAEFLVERRQTLKSLREMNLESKIIQTKYLIRQAVSEFGIDKVYISYSDGKNSTVLSHIAKTLYPDILHIFAITTNEYPETIQHIKWEQEKSHTNIITVVPEDVQGEIWTFQKVVERYGYPIFYKRVSNAIQTYQHALSPAPKQHSLNYIRRNFKKYNKYKKTPISDKCCEKLKKGPLQRKAKKLGLEESSPQKATSVRKSGSSTDATSFMNIKIIKTSFFPFGQMKASWNTSKNFISIFPVFTKWVIQETDACTVALALISSQMDVIACKSSGTVSSFV